MGFCPDIETDKTLCNGTGLTTHVLKTGKAYYLETTEKLTAPFIVLQGMTDKVCSYVETKNYMQGMKLGELFSLPNVGHGFSATKNWMPQFTTAYKKILNTPSYAEQKAEQNTLLQSQHLTPLPSDLPLTLIPTEIKDTLPMAFVISGDGGWTSFDQSVGEALAEKGMPVVGLDAQKYFWNAKTPEETTAAISKAAEHYMKQWNKNTFVLVGYSFGACVVPFVANRLQIALRENLRGVYSLSPDEKADFEIHLTDMLSWGSSKDNYDVIEEMKKINTLNPICVFGEEEEPVVRNHFSEAGIKIKTLPGTHHYNNDFNALAESILKSFLLK